MKKKYELKPDDYFKVPNWIWQEYQLKGLKRDLTSIIHGLSETGKGFYAPYDYLTQRLGYSEGEICKALKELTDKGIISKTETYHVGMVIRYEYRTVRNRTPTNTVVESITDDSLPF